MTTADRDALRAAAEKASDDGYTGNDNYGHLTVSPAVLTAALDAWEAAEAKVQAVKALVDRDGADWYYVHEWQAHAIPITDLRAALED